MLDQDFILGIIKKKNGVEKPFSQVETSTFFFTFISKKCFLYGQLSFNL